MEKILLAIDAINPDKNALDFACYLARLTNSTITGIFLENLIAEEKPVLKRIHGAAYVDWEVDETSPEHQIKMESVEKCIQWFKEGCIARDTRYRIHRDRGVPATEMVTESRFSDIIVADVSTSFSKQLEGIPGKFVREILRKAECPVIIAPESLDSVDEIVFAYNGSSSSVFAIKQFTYLFHEYNDKPVTIIQVNKEGEWLDPDKYKFKEWLSSHYQEMHFIAIKDNVENGLFGYMFKRKNTFLVMGAYGRNPLSLFFKKSHVDKLLRSISQPVFISHL